MDIFNSIENSKLQQLFTCLNARKKRYKRNQIIFATGDEIKYVLYILKGKVQLSRSDFDGNNIIIATVEKCDTFAEALVCGGVKISPITATAIEDTELLLMDFKKVITVCPSNCEFHHRLVRNIIEMISRKNIFLQTRIELFSKKSMRERILYFLRNESRDIGDKYFQINYSREQMAEYIGADRSALSRELSNMKQEGVIDYKKNVFKLSKP